MLRNWMDTVYWIAALPRPARQAPADPPAVAHRVSRFRAAVKTMIANTLINCGADVTDRDLDGIATVAAELGETVLTMAADGLVAVRRRQIVALKDKIGNAEADLEALRSQLAELEKSVPPELGNTP